MVKVKPLSQAKDNYESAALGVRPKYEQGIKDADWAQNAGSDAAEKLYQEKLQASMARNARQRGIQNVSNGDWQQRTLSKGAPNIGQAMAQSGDKWQQGFQPYADVLESISLPDKVADPATNVANRVTPIAVALSKKKISLQGG